jgi:hypothetical protein
MRVGKSLAVTNHAIERLDERMGIKGYKDIQRAVKKAWYDSKPICEEFWRSRMNLKKSGITTYHYRKYNKCIFCFQKKYYDIVLLTVFPEDSELLKKDYEANPKKFKRRYVGGSVLQKMHPAQGADVWGKDYFRTRYNLRREASERKMGDHPSVRKTPRSVPISRQRRNRQEIPRVGSIDETLQF